MNNHPNPAPIRVLIVDDSAFMRSALSHMIGNNRDFHVVGTAANGSEALARITALDPDVITLDVQMPGLDGVETLRRIMAQFPRPVIMVSSITMKDAEATFNALAAGAFDYVPKQLSSDSLDIIHIREELIGKIKSAAESRRGKASGYATRKPPRAPGSAVKDFVRQAPAIVAIGVSTGGPKALQEILPLLPRDLAVPILIVQHMPAGFTTPFARRLDKLCAISVCEAADGAVVRPGVVHLAPAGFHLIVERTGDSPAVTWLTHNRENRQHVPSVDVMMQSVASAFRSEAMGIIMTGMGSDGAQGMNAIHLAGGFTMGQDEESCAVYSMPRVCAEMGILDKVVPLAQIPREILRVARLQKSNAS